MSEYTQRELVMQVHVVPRILSFTSVPEFLMHRRDSGPLDDDDVVGMKLERYISWGFA